jgi:GNAT superfamily N-acetyltransferase
MATVEPEKAKAKCLLEPVNFHNPVEFDELHRQRVICGWYLEPAILEKWREMADEQTKSMFWILPPRLAGTTPSPARFVGHIAFQSISNSDTPESELDLANPDKSVLMVSNFFILPEYRSGGLGRAAMEALEVMARIEPYGSPKCKALTLHTPSRRYVEDDGEEWRCVRERLVQELPPKGRSVEDWYTRMGYVKWKEEPKYPETLADGTEVIIIASFLKKEFS